MSSRVLRSNTKVLSDNSIKSVKKSRKVILKTSEDLSNTPKESENEEDYRKKIKRRRIRRTENEFHIENICKSETIRNGQSNIQSSKTKNKRVRKKKVSILILDTSSDYNSVFEDEISPKKKIRKTKNKVRLPSVSLDDFQQSQQDIQAKHQLDNYNLSESKGCNSISDAVDKTIKQNGTEKRTSKRKVIPISNTTTIKKGLETKLSPKSSASFQSIYDSELECKKENFSAPLMMKQNHSTHLNVLSSYENLLSPKSEINFVKRKSCSTHASVSGDIFKKFSNSEDSYLKNEKQKNSMAIEEMIPNTKETKLSDIFDANKWKNSHSSFFETSRYVEDIHKQLDFSSDSEDETNRYPNQIDSDFPVLSQNEKTLLNIKEEYTCINSKKTVDEKIISMSTTVNSDNSESNSMSKQNEGVPVVSGRKRWTIFHGTEAKRKFDVQIENIRKSLLISGNDKATTSKNIKSSESRRSCRKRWSSELRKSVSALDISVQYQLDLTFEKNSGSNDLLKNLVDSDKCSANSRSTIVKETKQDTNLGDQIKNMGKSLLISGNDQATSQSNEYLESRQSRGMHWSDELRKSVSAVDISMQSKHDLTFEIHPRNDDLLENQEESDACSAKFRLKRRDTYEVDKNVANAKFLETRDNTVGVGVLSCETLTCLNASKTLVFENGTRRRIGEELQAAVVENSKMNKGSHRNCVNNSLRGQRSMSLQQSFSIFTGISSTPMHTFQKSYNKDKQNISQIRRRSKSVDGNTKLPKLEKMYDKNIERNKDKQNIYKIRRRSKSVDGNTITNTKIPKLEKIYDKNIEKRQKIVRVIERKPETKSQGDIRAQRRIVLKGVRSNRRFDLLMNMRKK